MHFSKKMPLCSILLTRILALPALAATDYYEIISISLQAGFIRVNVCCNMRTWHRAAKERILG